MANNFTNTQWVSMEILRLLLNKLEVIDYFNREWQKDFDKEFAPGSQVTVKFPQLFRTVDGMGYQPQAINRITTNVNLDQWIQVPFEWDDYERAVKLERSEEELRENYWEPAASAMSQEWDSRAAKWAYQNASNFTGVLGTDPTSVSTYYTARQIMMEEACPPGKRCMLISSSMMTSLGTNITTVFNPADEITKMWKEGAIGQLAKYMFYEEQALYSHTAGTWAGAVTINGAGQSGTSLTITATAGDTFNKGDKFSVLNVNRVNPRTYRIAGKKAVRTFTITQDLVAAGGGVDVINILPAIYGPGTQYQNVDALPANGAALTLFPGTANPNGVSGTVGLGLSRSAFAIVGAKLYLPKAVEERGQAQDPDTGIAVRKVVAWDPVRSMQINRMDSLGGFGNLYQASGACAVLGA
jgi:hypothetical protein